MARLARPPSALPLNILLVDDTPANLLALEAILEDLGQNLVRASSGEEALRILAREDFQAAVVLLDVQMPGLDGYETARQIRSQLRHRHTPIILITGYESDQTTLEQAYSLGAVDYLVKPLLPVVLRAKVIVFVELARQAQQLRLQDEQLRLAREEQLKRRALLQHAVAGLLTEVDSEGQAFVRVLRAVGEGLDWDVGGLWAVDPEAGVLRNTAFWRREDVPAGEFEQASRTQTLIRGQGLPGRVWAAGEVIWIEDISDDDAFSRSSPASRAGLHGACALPIRLSHEVVGVLELFSRLPRSRDEEILGALTAVGSQAGQSLQRRRAERALRESEERFRTLADSIPQLAWAARPDGHIYWYNRRWYEYTGTTPAQVEGWGWQSVHHPDELPRVLQRWRACIASGELFDMVFPLRGADGVFRPFLTRVLPLRGSDGRVLQWFGTNTDVTERIQAEEMLRQANRRKDELLAMLAHELRNPLAPLLVSLQVLRQAGANPTVRQDAIERMERQARALSRMVNDLLDVSRVLHGRVDLRPERLDLARLARTTAEDRRELLREADVALAVQTPQTPVWVRGDAVRLAQCVNNLLDNAARHGGPGIRVGVRVEADVEHSRAVLSVADTGRGIEPGLLPHLFEPFSQGMQGLDRSRGGLGLGLTVIKGLVELHQGTVEASSNNPEGGAVFTIRLPLEREPEALTSVPRSPSAAGRRHRVLVIEDNRDAADSLCLLLDLLGHDVRAAYSGPEGVQSAGAWVPEVVLSDIGLPGFDGYEVARRIRRLPGMEGALLVALTGYGGEEDRQRSREAGFNHHLVKPADPVDLQRVLSARVA